MHVLVVGSKNDLPGLVGRELTANQWTVNYASDIESARSLVQSADIDAMIVENQDDETPAFRSVLRSANDRHIATLVLGERSKKRQADDGPLIGSLSGDITAGEITRQLALLTRFQKHVRRMEREITHMQKLSEQLNSHFREIDDEMRLASRLQKDFLPRGIERIGPLSVSHIYRPASWVSGDMFDIHRVDENHIGFYLADAVGHGMAAGLLTMFIRRTLSAKVIRDNNYHILDPHEALQNLNNALAAHSLPNCQFVTAAYCLINTSTLEMRYARGGHPYPLIHCGGEMRELESPGGLLGLFDGMECETASVQLNPGDKVILYTDGLEAVFDGASANEGNPWEGHLHVLASLAGESVESIARKINEKLDSEGGSLVPEDDITILAVGIDG